MIVEQRRQQGQRGRDRQTHDEGARDPDRAQDHELEQHQPEQPEQDGQAAEEHRPTGRGDRDPHGVAQSIGVVRRGASRAPPGTGSSCSSE